MLNKTNTTMYGIDVIENHMLPETSPKIQLSCHFKWCTEEFREKQNKYLLDRFGVGLHFLMTVNPMTKRKTIITHPSNMLKLKNSLDNI